MTIKKSLLVLFFCLIRITPLLAQEHLKSAESIALGNTSFSGGLCVFSSKSCYSNTFEIQLHHRNLFTKSELNSFSLECLFPNPNMTTAIGISTFGYRHYRENTFSMALSKRIGQKFALGVITQFQTLYYTDCTKIAKNINVSLDAYFNIHHKDFIYTKFQHFFPLNTTYNKENLLVLGIHSQSSLSSSWIMEIKTLDFQPPSIHIGFEYLVKHFAFRLGGYGLPIRPSYGVGFLKGRWTINMTADWLINIGHSFCCDIILKLNKK